MPISFITFLSEGSRSLQRQRRKAMGEIVRAVDAAIRASQMQDVQFKTQPGTPESRIVDAVIGTGADREMQHSAGLALSAHERMAEVSTRKQFRNEKRSAQRLINAIISGKIPDQSSGIKIKPGEESELVRSAALKMFTDKANFYGKKRTGRQKDVYGSTIGILPKEGEAYNINKASDDMGKISLGGGIVDAAIKEYNKRKQSRR